jgi:hypothetical protein
MQAEQQLEAKAGRLVATKRQLEVADMLVVVALPLEVVESQLKLQHQVSE